MSDEQQSIASRLPSGQRRAGLERFGHPHFAYRSPEVPERPVITITGEVRVPVQIPLDELLAAAPRREQRSDLHCVTTWSACDLVWSGAPMAALYDVLATQVRPRSGVCWLTVTGLDGARASLALEDALADDVLLADRLGGAPLTVDHGAPCRLVAPAHYGYKSIKGVCMIEFRRHYEAGASGWRVHPRGRVAREERSRCPAGRGGTCGAPPCRRPVTYIGKQRPVARSEALQRLDQHLGMWLGKPAEVVRIAGEDHGPAVLDGRRDNQRVDG